MEATGNIKGKIDLSIISSYKCNLTCWFCMYDAGPEKNEWLDLGKLKEFLLTVDWRKINSIGFYGGEVSQWLDKLQEYIDLIPDAVSKFCITNGSWSRDFILTGKFIDFVLDNKLWVKISNTDEHRKYQNVKLLKLLEKSSKGYILVKERDDTKSRLNPMGVCLQVIGVVQRNVCV